MKNVTNEKTASFKPYMKIDVLNIKKLKNNTICPIEKGIRLLNKIAKTSVPSNDPPNRITMPTPNPKIIPPMIITKNGLLVMEGYGSRTWVPIESTEIAKRLRIRNLFPRYEYPNKKKGVFSSRSDKPISILEICESIILTPTIPPSITLFFTKNNCNEMATSEAPQKTYNNLLFIDI